MATYDSLTQEQKDQLALGEQWIRGALVTLKVFIDAADFDLKRQYWIDNIAPILALLDDGELIPLSTGHGGASDLTDLNFAQIYTWLTGIDDDMSTNISLLVKAIGVNS